MHPRSADGARGRPSRRRRSSASCVDARTQGDDGGAHRTASSRCRRVRHHRGDRRDRDVGAARAARASRSGSLDVAGSTTGSSASSIDAVVEGFLRPQHRGDASRRRRSRRRCSTRSRTGEPPTVHKWIDRDERRRRAHRWRRSSTRGSRRGTRARRASCTGSPSRREPSAGRRCVAVGQRTTDVESEPASSASVTRPRSRPRVGPHEARVDAPDRAGRRARGRDVRWTPSRRQLVEVGRRRGVSIVDSRSRRRRARAVGTPLDARRRCSTREHASSGRRWTSTARGTAARVRRRHAPRRRSGLGERERSLGPSAASTGAVTGRLGREEQRRRPCASRYARIAPLAARTYALCVQPSIIGVVADAEPEHEPVGIRVLDASATPRSAVDRRRGRRSARRRSRRRSSFGRVEQRASTHAVVVAVRRPPGATRAS